MCVKCHFCEATLADLETAATIDWTPGYWTADDDFVDCVVCHDCTKSKLQEGFDGEMELKPE